MALVPGVYKADKGPPMGAPGCAGVARFGGKGHAAMDFVGFKDHILLVFSVLGLCWFTCERL